MEGEEGKQQPHLVLAHKLFHLTHPDVEDIDKVRFREEVLSFVLADGKIPPPQPLLFYNALFLFTLFI